MTMKFSQPGADIYIPDNATPQAALRRTTHLCIAAHQDDIEIFAYPGIAACYQKPDLWFTGVVVTDGAGSSRAGAYADYTDAQMKAVRREEQRKAAHLGGYSVQIQLDHPSSAAKDKAGTAVVSDLVAILKEMQPEVVYLHNPADKHDTHVAVLARCITALRSLSVEKRPKKVYGCEVWRSLDWLMDADKQVLDAGAQPNMAAALVALFDSQVSGGKRYDLATLGRRLANATFFESHASDKSTSLVWAMDLSPLMLDDRLSLAQHTLEYLKRFQEDVARRIDKFSA